MLPELDQFYLNQNEPNRSCFEALRDIILKLDDDITPEWKYKLPFFYCKGKMFCYLWKDRKTGEPYIGITEGHRLDHPMLEQGNRKRMKILRVDPNEDLDVGTIKLVLRRALEFY